MAENREDMEVGITAQLEAAEGIDAPEDNVPEDLRAQNDQLMRHILEEKRGQPNKYASFWEMDDEDVEHWSQKEIEEDPVKLILWAAEHGKMAVILKLLQEMPDLVNARDADGYSPLHRAAYGGHCKTADLLISHGADVMARTKDGWTPLHSAAHWDHWDMCELLLNLGAEPNVVTESGNTALHIACSQCQTPRTIAFLLHWPYLRHDLRNSQGDTAKELCQRHCSFSKDLFGDE